MSNEIISARCAARFPVSEAAEVITEVAHRIADALELSAEEVHTELTKREKVGSTGLAHGVAIPHCGLPNADSFVVGIITTEEGIAFGAIDGGPTDIFVFVAGPEHRRSDHVRFLASITAQLREDPMRREIRDADNADRLNSILRERLLPAEEERSVGAHSVLVVYVQDEELYEPLLETVSGEPNASVAVSEARSAGSILHRMPLFATFWNEQETGEIHRIEVILPRDQTNRAIRRLEELIQGRRGVQISAFDLNYGSGVLDL
ncbi:MAG: PTS transporter subunit EIIA [Spirochaetes bacterium]|nr:PTS transporter subunit EIIA [Spirochaetota bacterium]